MLCMFLSSVEHDDKKILCVLSLTPANSGSDVGHKSYEQEREKIEWEIIGQNIMHQ